MVPFLSYKAIKFGTKRGDKASVVKVDSESYINHPTVLSKLKKSSGVMAQNYEGKAHREEPQVHNFKHSNEEIDKIEYPCKKEVVNKVEYPCRREQIHTQIVSDKKNAEPGFWENCLNKIGYGSNQTKNVPSGDNYNHKKVPATNYDNSSSQSIKDSNIQFKVLFCRVYWKYKNYRSKVYHEKEKEEIGTVRSRIYTRIRKTIMIYPQHVF